MTTVAQKSPVVLAPAAAVDSVGLVDELWGTDGISDAILDGATDTERVIAAAGAVETLEWELDRARSALAAEVERAASHGCSVDIIAGSAGMTKEDIVTLLWAARSERS